MGLDSKLQNKLKVLLVGDFRFDYYDQSLYLAMERSQFIDVCKFEIAPYFYNYKFVSVASKIYYAFQNRYKIGPVINKINSDLIGCVNETKFDLVFVWRGIHFNKKTLLAIKRTGAKLFGYNNDSTNSKKHPWWLFYLLKRQIGIYDHYYAYRSGDMDFYKKSGARSSLFFPTYDPLRTFPILSTEKKFDLVFIGHYEDDGRDELFVALSKLGRRIGLFGQGWKESKLYPALLNYYGEICPVIDDYNHVINSSLIALTILSSSNGDTYTRRSLEIPSTGTAMLAPNTDQHRSWFRRGIEAFYFESYDEIPSVLESLLSKRDLIADVALAGYRKVTCGDFKLEDRVSMILFDYGAICNE
jgi:spore maturation protein CgeB